VLDRQPGLMQHAEAYCERREGLYRTPDEKAAKCEGFLSS
jgi:hypothetical protein